MNKVMEEVEGFVTRDEVISSGSPINLPITI
jgi:hypothetical protein